MLTETEQRVLKEGCQVCTLGLSLNMFSFSSVTPEILDLLGCGRVVFLDFWYGAPETLLCVTDPELFVMAKP
jgi:hypothetical protein